MRTIHPAGQWHLACKGGLAFDAVLSNLLQQESTLSDEAIS
jgi:hypothetical protein